MRIAICDDLSEQVDIIKKATIEYFTSRHIAFQIDTFRHAFDFLDFQEKRVYDLALLDICMPGMLGTEIAREIRTRDDQTCIVFLTTSHEFAVEAFEVNAIHYLLKPFTQKAFDQAIDRVMRHMTDNQTKMVNLKCPKGVIKSVDKDLICYIESNSHRQRVILLDGTQIETVQTLNELFQSLDDLSHGQFILPYKGFIVNQHAISAIESDEIILKTGRRIPIPRRTFHSIKKAYFSYMFNRREL